MEEHKSMRESENSVDGATDQCAEHGALNNPEFAGFVFGEPSEYDYIPMSVRSAMSSLDEKEFEFDISGMSTVESSQELEAIASPTEKLLYKWRTQPFHHTISTQVVEKSSFSQTKPFGAQATTETENMGSRRNISRNCSLEKEELRSSASHKSCDDPSYKVDKDSKDIHSKVSAPYRSKKQMDSAQSRQTAMCHNFRASFNCLFSKSSKSRGPNVQHLQNSIQKGSNHRDDAAATGNRSSNKENSHATPRKPFSFIKGFPLIPKPNPKPLSSSNSISSSIHSINSLQKRDLSSVNSSTENDIQEAISHCKQSHSTDTKNARHFQTCVAKRLKSRRTY